MKAGETIRLRSFRHINVKGNPIRSATFTAPPGKVFVALLLCVEDKDIDSVDKMTDPNEVLRAWGWEKRDE